jgi:hypothetical protein
MENIISKILLVMLSGLVLFVLYQAIKNWKFVLSYLLMPLTGMLVMALFLRASQFNVSHPVLLGIAGTAIGGLSGHLLALKNNWE